MGVEESKMAKFEVMITEHVQQSVQYIIKVTKQEVVEALGLEGDEAKEWKERVGDFIETDVEGILHRDGSERGDMGDSDTMSTDIDSVSELE